MYLLILTDDLVARDCSLVSTINPGIWINASPGFDRRTWRRRDSSIDKKRSEIWNFASMGEILENLEARLVR